MAKQLVLGSGSPRRQELLAEAGYAFEVRRPEVEEIPPGSHSIRELAVLNAVLKARSLVKEGEETVVLAADTTVAMGRRIFGKPADEKEAAAFLIALSGRRHRVFTCVAVSSDKGLRHRVVESVVRMKRLSDIEVNGYLASGDWRGKAGGYAIQGPAGTFIPWISGSYSAIMGLPV